MMSIRNIATPSVFVAYPDESVQAVAERMRKRNVGTLVIVDCQKNPVGIVTDRDLTLGVIAEGRDSMLTKVADVMSEHVMTVSPETSVEDALRLMRNGAFRRLPVTDEEGKLTGLVSLNDVLGQLCHEFRDIGQLLTEEDPPARRPSKHHPKERSLFPVESIK